MRAVDQVSLRVDRGRTLGTAGESGCGKSTTGRLALAIEPPDSGEGWFDNELITRASGKRWRRLRARMQMVFQDRSARSIGGSVAQLKSLNHCGSIALVGQPRDGIGLASYCAPSACALATAPALLVCDEPVSALDVSIQAQIANLLTDLQAESSVAMLCGM